MECLPICGGEKLKWFRDAKLGLFLHVGISALGKVDIGWSRKTHKLPDPGEGPIPDEVYDGWANEIKMEDFDADEWIDLAISGGFKYVVIITKHHDGFHMWDTEYSDYKITNAPMARDYIKELTDACHKKGMPLGKHWGWTGEELKPFKEIIRQFICTVSGDGNYLISIGCMPTGKIASEESEHIRKLGAFMEKYGSAIYGTRSGPWNPGDFGGSVYRGDTAYIHIVERPKNGILVFPLKHNEVKEIECITDDDVRFVIKDNNLVITVPKIEFEDIIVKVQMAHNIQTSIEGISVENSEVTQSHIADIEIVQIQNKE